MEDYPSNSNKSKRKLEEEAPKPVVIKSEDAVKNPKAEIVEQDALGLKSYFMNEIFNGVIKPAAQNTIMDISRSILNGIHDAIDDGLNAVVYKGEKPPRDRRESFTRTSYDAYYEDRRRRRRNSNSNREPVVSRSRSSFDYDNIIFPTKDEAKDALDTFIGIFQDNGIATVMDLYRSANIKSDNYMYTKYGWINIDSVRIVPVQDGYSIKLPKPMYIDD